MWPKCSPLLARTAVAPPALQDCHSKTIMERIIEDGGCTGGNHEKQTLASLLYTATLITWNSYQLLIHVVVIWRPSIPQCMWTNLRHSDKLVHGSPMSNHPLSHTWHTSQDSQTLLVRRNKTKLKTHWVGCACVCFCCSVSVFLFSLFAVVLFVPCVPVLLLE